MYWKVLVYITIHICDEIYGVSNQSIEHCKMLENKNWHSLPWCWFILSHIFFLYICRDVMRYMCMFSRYTAIFLWLFVTNISLNFQQKENCSYLFSCAPYRLFLSHRLVFVEQLAFVFSFLQASVFPLLTKASHHTHAWEERTRKWMKMRNRLWQLNSSLWLFNGFFLLILSLARFPIHIYLIREMSVIYDTKWWQWDH